MLACHSTRLPDTIFVIKICLFDDFLFDFLVPKVDIIEAQESSTKTLELCDKIRPQTFKDNFFYKIFFNADYETCSEGKESAYFLQLTFSFCRE